MANGKTGRPKAQIDADVMKGLAKLHCTLDEAAAFFNVSKRTIERHLAADLNLKMSWTAGQLVGKVSLRRLMWEHAQQKNSSGAQMCIHLSKHWLGMSEKSLMEMQHSGAVGSYDLSKISDADLKHLEQILGPAAVGADQTGTEAAGRSAES